jgi:hypothetical protein
MGGWLIYFTGICTIILLQWLFHTWVTIIRFSLVFNWPPPRKASSPAMTSPKWFLRIQNTWFAWKAWVMLSLIYTAYLPLHVVSSWVCLPFSAIFHLVWIWIHLHGSRLVIKWDREKNYYSVRWCLMLW